MRRWSGYITVLLVYLMTPGAGELTENVIHLVTSGHTAHSIDDDTHQSDDPEHGCSGPYHLCTCHASVVFTVAAVAAGVALSSVENAGLAGYAVRLPAEGYVPGVFRPPIV